MPYLYAALLQHLPDRLRITAELCSDLLQAVPGRVQPLRFCLLRVR